MARLAREKPFLWRVTSMVRTKKASRSQWSKPVKTKVYVQDLSDSSLKWLSRRAGLEGRNSQFTALTFKSIKKESTICSINRTWKDLSPMDLALNWNGPRTTSKWRTCIHSSVAQLRTFSLSITLESRTRSSPRTTWTIQVADLTRWWRSQLNVSMQKNQTILWSVPCS